MNESHTIILAQFLESPSSKCYSEHETLTGAIETICQLYEARLRQNSNADMVYDLQELFAFIDSIPDLVMLVFNKSTSSYDPHHRGWIKNVIYQKFVAKGTHKR